MKQCLICGEPSRTNKYCRPCARALQSRTMLIYWRLKSEARRIAIGELISERISGTRVAANSASDNTTNNAIALLGKWHRAYHDSRIALETVDDETVKYLAGIAQQH